MAAPPEIKVRITGDTKGLEDAGKEVAKTLGQVNASISKLEKEIADNIRISRGYAGAVEELNNELKNGTISQGQYQKALSRLRRDEKETELATKELRRELSVLKKDSRNLQSASLGAAKGQSALSNQIRGTTPTLLEFNHVIQDAPFGIRGVANNIQQLVGNFQVLRQNAGSTKAAFASLIGSFIGPAGILFAVSVVTSLLTVYGDKLFKVISSTKDLSKSIGKYVGSAQKEILVLRNLVGIAEDENQSKFVRERALNRINKEYGDYLGNLSLEELKTESVRQKVDALTDSLIRQAQVRGIESLLEDRFKKAAPALQDFALRARDLRLKIEKEIQSLVDNVAAFGNIDTTKGFRQNLLEIEEIINRAGGSGAGRVAGLQFLVNQFKSVQNQSKKFKNELKSDLSDTADVLREFTVKDLIAEVDKINEVAVTGKLIDQAELAKRAAKMAELIKKTLKNIEVAESIIDVEDALDNAEDINKIYAESGAKVRDIFKGIDLSELKQAGKEFAGFGKVIGENLDNIKKSFDVEGIEQGFQKILAIEKKLAELKKKVTPETFSVISGFELEQLKAFEKRLEAAKLVGEAFTSAIGQGFSQLGSLISNSLQTGIGVLDIFVSTLVNGIAKLAASFAQKAIIDRLFAASSLGSNLTAANANAITIATSAAAGFGPLGFAVLPGLLAETLGQVNAAFAAIPKFAQGGFVGGGSFTGDQILARLNSGERVLTIQDQGILTRVLQGNLRSINNSNTPISVEGIIRGNDILLANKRAERKNKRFGR